MKLKSFVIWGVVVIAIAGVIYGLVELAKTSPVNQANVEYGNGAIPAVTPNDWTQGDKNSSTTLIEYGDFECPVCAAYAPVLSQLQKDFNGKFLFVYRYFPLETIHPNSAISTAAAEAAGEQGKFWQMHDLLFQNQNEWVNQSQSDAEKTFVEYATELGLNTVKFETDMTSPAVMALIQSDYDNDLKMGLTYTPTFVLNGKIIQNPTSYDAFKQVLQSAIGGQ